ncbi:PrgI family protein [Lacrimispora sp. 38-1]|uniref:PrgI family protein n=1 Tax=Lacrimispora sp. 38-1 TaxID=3125778 RepID=UPI003CF9396E
MVIEINKDIDKYQESVAMGLTAKQLVFSVASVVCGGGIVLLLYRYIGLTGSAYVAIPVVAPIALGGFYSYNGMSFYDVMRRKFHMMFCNRALTYASTEGEPAIKAYELELANTAKIQVNKRKGKRNNLVDEKQTTNKATDNKKKNQEDFEIMKRKMKGILIGSVVTIVLAIAGTIAYKCFK